MGPITLFAMLKSLLPPVIHSMDFKWYWSTQYLCNVSQKFVVSWFFDVNAISKKFCFQAVQKQVSDFDILSLVARNVSQQWSKICKNNKLTSHQQGFQNVKKRVSVPLALPLGLTSLRMYLVTRLRHPQGIDWFITGNPFFISGWESFQVTMQDFAESFGVLGANRCTPGFFSGGQLLSFLPAAADDIFQVNSINWETLGQYSLLRVYRVFVPL